MTGDFGDWKPSEAVALCERALANLAVVRPWPLRDAVADLLHRTVLVCQMLEQLHGDRSEAMLGRPMAFDLRLAQAVADAKPGDE